MWTPCSASVAQNFRKLLWQQQKRALLLLPVARGRLDILRLLRIFCVFMYLSLCVHTYQVRTNYVEACQEQKHQKRAATCDAYRVANQQRMASRRALEWIGTSKAWLVFRYEISDLFFPRVYNVTMFRAYQILPTCRSKVILHRGDCSA